MAQRVIDVISLPMEEDGHEVRLSCSVGISDNKQRAKVATGFAKPAGVSTLTDANWMTVMSDRPVDALWGVGPVTAGKLRAHGIERLVDVRNCAPEGLRAVVGSLADWLIRLAHGLDDRLLRIEVERDATDIALVQDIL